MFGSYWNGMLGSAGKMPEPAVDVPAPPPELLVVGRFDQRPGYAVRRAAGARNWLLTWTTAGAGRFGQGGARIVAGPGDAVLIGPHAPHDYATDPEAGHWRFWWVHVQPRERWLDRLQPHAAAARLFVLSPDPALRRRITATFRRIHADARWSAVGAPPAPVAAAAANVRTAVASTSAARDLALAGVETVLLLAAGGSADTGAGLDPRIRRALAVIAADPAAPHTVATLAGQVALSPSRFAHLFTEHTGSTPMRALREARLTHAARLLEGTQLDVAQVAAASGFASPFHFSRAFRARFGAPPGAYRKR